MTVVFLSVATMTGVIFTGSGLLSQSYPDRSMPILSHPTRANFNRAIQTGTFLTGSSQGGSSWLYLGGSRLASFSQGILVSRPDPVRINSSHGGSSQDGSSYRSCSQCGSSQGSTIQQDGTTQIGFCLCCFNQSCSSQGSTCRGSSDTWMQMLYVKRCGTCFCISSDWNLRDCGQIDVSSSS